MLDDRYLDWGGSENETMHCKLKKVEFLRERGLTLSTPNPPLEL